MHPSEQRQKAFFGLRIALFFSILAFFMYPVNTTYGKYWPFPPFFLLSIGVFIIRSENLTDSRKLFIVDCGKPVGKCPPHKAHRPLRTLRRTTTPKLRPLDSAPPKEKASDRRGSKFPAGGTKVAPSPYPPPKGGGWLVGALRPLPLPRGRLVSGNRGASAHPSQPPLGKGRWPAGPERFYPPAAALRRTPNPQTPPPRFPTA